MHYTAWAYGEKKFFNWGARLQIFKKLRGPVCKFLKKKLGGPGPQAPMDGTLIFTQNTIKRNQINFAKEPNLVPEPRSRQPWFVRVWVCMYPLYYYYMTCTWHVEHCAVHLRVYYCIKRYMLISWSLMIRDRKNRFSPIVY